VREHVQADPLRSEASSRLVDGGHRPLAVALPLMLAENQNVIKECEAILFRYVQPYVSDRFFPNDSSSIAISLTMLAPSPCSDLLFPSHRS